MPIRYFSSLCLMLGLLAGCVSHAPVDAQCCATATDADYDRIARISSLKQIDLSQADKDTLVVFDVDYTLTCPDASTGMFNTHRKKWAQIISETKAKYPAFAADQDHYFSLIFLQQEERVMEQEVHGILDELKRHGIRTIACTSWPAGRLGMIADAAQHRCDVLRGLGISFADSYPEMKGTLNTAGVPSDKQPDFREGVICTNGVDKGTALQVFFRQSGLKPKKVILVDDALNKLHDVRKACAAEGIEFIGYHYTFPEEVRWNEDLVRFKITRLIEEKAWFKNDEEAMEAYRKAGKLPPRV